MNKDPKHSKEIKFTSADFGSIKSGSMLDAKLSQKSDDKLANKEVRYFTDDETKGKEYREVIHCLAKISIWIFYVLFMILIGIRFLHLVIPECCYWLTIEQIFAIERIIYSSIILSFASDYFRKFNLLSNSK